MTDRRHDDPASEFVVRWIGALAAAVPPPRRALDVAMGRGRHARLLARSGFRAFGVDVRFDAVREAVERAAAEGTTVRGWCADLTRSRLPRGWFALVVVTRYLQRDLFPALAATLAPGGVLLYETFTEAQRALGRGPSSPDHLLRPGELRAAFSDLELLFYEEALEPDAVARLAARRRHPGAGRAPERESLRSSARS
jgi:SAM-dependent methyltransferase